MVEERDEVALRRDARVADPAPGLVEHLADRVLEPRLARDGAHDGEVRAVGSPIGPVHVFEKLARRPARERHLRERAAPDEPARPVALEGDRELARARDREDLGVRQHERARLGALGSRREEPAGLAFPRRAVDHRAPVRGEARGEDRAAPEAEALERRMSGRRLLDAGGSLARQLGAGGRAGLRGLARGRASRHSGRPRPSRGSAPRSSAAAPAGAGSASRSARALRG